MKHKIIGTVMQMVTIEFKEGEKIFSEAGAMAWMSENVNMEAKARGGLAAGIGRMLSGETFFLTEFTVEGTGFVTFGSEVPGKIIELKLKDGESIICQKDSFLCAENLVNLEMHFRKKLGSGLFGGEGFILQKLTGPGTVFVNVGGEVIEMDLKKGEKIKIDTGSIAMFEPSVKYDIQRVGGIKTMIFGGEGIFLATLEGPGKIWLQSMPVASLAMKIASYIPTSG